MRQSHCACSIYQFMRAYFLCSEWCDGYLGEDPGHPGPLCSHGTKTEYSSAWTRQTRTLQSKAHASITCSGVYRERGGERGGGREWWRCRGGTKNNTILVNTQINAVNTWMNNYIIYLLVLSALYNTVIRSSNITCTWTAAQIDVLHVHLRSFHLY